MSVVSRDTDVSILSYLGALKENLLVSLRMVPENSGNSIRGQLKAIEDIKNRFAHYYSVVQDRFNDENNNSDSSASVPEEVSYSTSVQKNWNRIKKIEKRVKCLMEVALNIFSDEKLSPSRNVPDPTNRINEWLEKIVHPNNERVSLEDSQDFGAGGGAASQ